MSPEAMLGPALAEAVRELVRQELQTRGGGAPTISAPERRLITVPKAAKAAGISEETIRELIRARRIPERLAGANPSPKRPTYLVYVDEVLAALERPPAGAGEQAEPIDLQKHAARLRARAEKRGG